MALTPNLDPLLERKLAAFRAVPARDPQAAARGRAAFLARAQELSAALPVTAPSVPSPAVHAKFPERLAAILGRIPAPVTILFVLALLLAFSGTLAVSAAQASLPGQGLYPLKTLSEEVRIGLAGNPATRVTLQIEFSNRRFEEAYQLVQSGQELPQSFLASWQQQMDRALQRSASMDDINLRKVLLVMQAQLNAQLQQVQAWLARYPAADRSGVLQVQAMLQDSLRWVQAGLVDPASFRLHFQPGGQLPTSLPQQTSPTPSPGEQKPQQASRTPEPGGGPGSASTPPGSRATRAPGKPTSPGMLGSPATTGLAHTPQATSPAQQTGEPHAPASPDVTRPGENPNGGSGGGNNGPGDGPGNGGGNGGKGKH